MKLSRRERYAVSMAAVVAFVYILGQFVALPLYREREKKERSIVAKEAMLSEMILLRSEYDEIRRQQKRVETELKGLRSFSLIPFLESLAGKVGIKENIAHINASKSEKREDSPYLISRVEIKLQAIDMTRLQNFLYEVETPDQMVYVGKITITRKGGAENGYIDVIMNVETYEMVRGSGV